MILFNRFIKKADLFLADTVTFSDYGDRVVNRNDVPQKIRIMCPENSENIKVKGLHPTLSKYSYCFIRSKDVDVRKLYDALITFDGVSYTVSDVELRPSMSLIEFNTKVFLDEVV